MVALTEDRNTKMQLGEVQEYPVLAATVCYGGGIAVLDAAGWCKPGVTALGLVATGRFDARADNSAGGNGDIAAKVRPGVFRFANSAAADAITAAEIGDDCFIVDDQTVAKTDGVNTRSVAGKIVQVDALGVWVRIGF